MGTYGDIPDSLRSPEPNDQGKDNDYNDDYQDEDDEDGTEK